MEPSIRELIIACCSAALTWRLQHKEALSWREHSTYYTVGFSAFRLCLSTYHSKPVRVIDVIVLSFWLFDCSVTPWIRGASQILVALDLISSGSLLLGSASLICLRVVKCSAIVPSFFVLQNCNRSVDKGQVCWEERCSLGGCDYICLKEKAPLPLAAWSYTSKYQFVAVSANSDLFWHEGL